MELTATYQKPVIAEIKRMLSLLDREPHSVTYGCFDRTYWCWKFTDFPGARFQEGVYSLAHLYTFPFPGNDLAKNPVVLGWITAGFRYWQKIQYSDGSFDEAYPFERSLAAVAFTGFYLGEAFLLVSEKLPASEAANIRETLTKAGDWLCNNDERHGVLSNHLAAAAAALCAIWKITGEARFRDRMQFFLNRIYERQSKEGWYEEYGGADPGYQTHATFYLARIWQHTKDDKLLGSLKNSLEFLKYCIHPNGTLGGEYASRNTEFYYPAGLEILAEVIPDAASIAGFMRSSVLEQRAAGLAAMDAYNFFPLLNNYLFASLNAKDLDESGRTLPCKLQEERLFSDAGIFVNSNAKFFAVLGLSKGGTLKVFDKNSGKINFCDSGYFAITKNGKALSHQTFLRPGDWSRNGDSFEIRAPFYSISRTIQKPWLFLGFRGFMLTLGRHSKLAYWVKNLLVTVLVRKKPKSGLEILRKIHLETGSITISDEIRSDGSVELASLRTHPKFATFHMGSSRYFQGQDLQLPPEGEDKAQALMLQRKISVTRKIDL